jgi:uncharacterized protein YyaL (SSP411 family)
VPERLVVTAASLARAGQAGGVTNRLAGETSPYLLQHKDNPVDWWPWGEEAFAEARRRDVPVLLSVGYAACHWCHVMAHESFEDPEVAVLVNAAVVPVKVDREERPDVDAVHMEVTQAMTGSGGWPMTVFLTPDAQPFYAGTYFPPRPSRGLPSFAQLVAAVGEAWRDRRTEIVEQGAEVVARLARPPRAAAAGALDAAVLDAAVRSLARDADRVRGGFGTAPKFPPSMVLEALLRHAARTGDGQALELVRETCHAMARGGIYDQLGGGFARYSVDADWVVPHFEKMLYDNALLARVYLHLWRQTADPLAERVARETCAWLLRDLRTPEGGFASALDADSVPAGQPDGHPEEGAFYAWTPEEVGHWVADLCDVTAAGTFEAGRSVLQLRRDPDDPAWWAGERERLLALRETRPAPARDDKVVAAWVGLAVAALAECGALLEQPAWVDAAAMAADLLLRVHLVDGRLRRTSRAGVVGRNAGVLEDYGDVAEGLLALHQVSGERRWLDAAGGLLDTVLTHFGDGRGGFFDTADDAQTLISRPADPTDNAAPGGAAAAAGALLTYAALTGSARHREAAEAALAVVAPVAAQHARFAGWSCAVAEAALAGPLEVAVVGRPDLLALARMSPSPGVVVVAGDSPLLEGRTAPAAYVCRGAVCELPTTDADVLRGQLSIGG